MTVHLEYTAQLKQAAGTSRETLEVPEGATFRSACALAATRHGEEFRRLLLTSEGTLQPTLLAFHCDQPVLPQADPPLKAGDTLTLMSPISGG
jgi:molybdopterin converting factor small subunit